MAFDWYMDQNVMVQPMTPIDHLLKDLRDLEWSQRRHGAQPFPGAVPMVAACCPVCFGLKPSPVETEVNGATYYDPNVYAGSHNFHEADFGHRETCALQRAFIHIAEVYGRGTADTVGTIEDQQP